MNKLKILSLLLVLAISLNACKSTQNNKKDDSSPQATMDPYPSGVGGNCPVPENWFLGKSVPVPDPINFPNHPGEVTNCDFHQISWQYFLWLTEEVDGKLRFETMFTNKAIRPEYQNDKYHVLDITEQALSKGVLVDQNGRAVYSNIIINDTFQNFVLENKLYDRDSMYNFDPNIGFPPGSLTLKPSWKIVEEGEDTTGMYVTTADIGLLELIDGEPRIPANNFKTQKNVKVALIALHIAVVVQGHPEFIWATFEYDRNAPDFPESIGLNDPVSQKNWLLYEAGTTARAVNTNNAEILKFVDQEAQTLSPVTQVARQYKNGGGKVNPNQNNIEDLNKEVKAGLAGRRSIWQNYFEVGAVWFDTDKGHLQPNWNPNVVDSMLTGSLKLSNSTIETFTQKVASQNECFSCHNSSSVANVPSGVKALGGKNINLSHVLLKNYKFGAEIPSVKE